MPVYHVQPMQQQPLQRRLRTPEPGARDTAHAVPTQQAEIRQEPSTDGVPMRAAVPCEVMS